MVTLTDYHNVSSSVTSASLFLLLRNEAGGLALSPCQKQHQEVWMGEKGIENEAALMMCFVMSHVSPRST